MAFGTFEKRAESAGFVSRRSQASTVIWMFLVVFQGPTYLVFEFAEHGSLLDYLQQSKVKCDNGYLQAERMSSDLQKLKIALDIARGMKHVAEKKVSGKFIFLQRILLWVSSNNWGK